MAPFRGHRRPQAHAQALPDGLRLRGAQPRRAVTVELPWDGQEKWGFHRV